MDDEQLLALKKNGGVIQIVGFASYIKSDSKERTAAITKLRDEFGLASLGGRGGGGPAAGQGGGEAEGSGAARACPVEGSAGAAVQNGKGGASFSLANFGLDALSSGRRAEYEKRLAVLDGKFPPASRANVKDFVNHIDYAVKLIGIDHVGISSDFDGGGGIDGWNSAAEAFNVTLELVRRGYTEEQIGKLWSGNLLRVWAEVQKVSERLQKERG